MSSFASRAREEIAARSIQKDCCVRAAAYGIACFAKYFDARGLVVQTEQQETVQAAQQLFARCGVQGEILQKQRPSGVLYEFNIRAPEQVARMHELFGTTGSETSLQIDPRLIRCQTCVSAYIGAAFLCSGTVIDPQKEYNLEFLTSRTNLARDFEALLAEHEFAPHRTRRNGVNLIYVKTGANVERLLSFMGAVNAAEYDFAVLDKSVYIDVGVRFGEFNGVINEAHRAPHITHGVFRPLFHAARDVVFFLFGIEQIFDEAGRVSVVIVHLVVNYLAVLIF